MSGCRAPSLKKLLINGKFVAYRCLSTQVESLKIDERFNGSSQNLTEEWNEALPYEKIPGPSGLSLVLSHLPGGKHYKNSFEELTRSLRKTYGDFMKIPGVFGHKDIILCHDPETFKIVFRNEGIWPNRKEFDTMDYYRRKCRPDVFSEAPGLITQGKEWGDFRSAVNPSMMQPKTVKLYIPIIDNIAADFIERIRQIRNKNTLESPEDFEEEINKWALESISAISFDTRLGLLNNTAIDPKVKALIDANKQIFQLVFDLDVKPSLWKLISTPKFKRLMAALDTITNISNDYIEEAKQRYELQKTTDKESEGVLQKLLKINPKIAQVMAIDTLFAGIDTTTSAFVATLYLLAKNPDKQEILRKEINSILPTKNSPLTVENMNNLPYLRACIKEALRLKSVSSSNIRSAGKDLVLNGYRIPKGTDVLMGSFALHLEDKHYPQAKKYIPERWLKESRPDDCPSAKTAHPFIYLPFGFGPRMCIGKRFALMEIEILIAKILRNFNVEWNHPDLKFKSILLNTPDGKLMFKLSDIDK